MKIIRDNILCNNITFIDGLQASGKTLVAPIISSLSNAELWRLNHLYEYILVLLDLKKISFDAAASLLKIYADIDLYNLAISRDVNFRSQDESSPHNNLLTEIYAKRLSSNGGDIITSHIQKNNPSLLIMTHFIAEKVHLIDKIFNDRKWQLVVILRNPATVIKKWYESGFFKKVNKDPREFTITLESEGIGYPWYGTKEKLKTYSEIEHLANFVINYFDAQDKISNKYKNSYTRVNFEKFESNPFDYISDFESIYGSQTKTTDDLIKKFDLPRKNSLVKRLHQNKADLIYVLSLIDDEDMKNRLTDLCEKYDEDIK